MTSLIPDSTRLSDLGAPKGPVAGHLVHLDPDHPGFRDPEYRARRNTIARLALEHRPGDPVPDVPYTKQEHRVWKKVWRKLGKLHRRRGCKEYLEALELIELDKTRIPQLAEVNASLKRCSGFRMEPVAGLIVAKDFLVRLGEGVFLCTQYIRHHSRPFYTPEPDIVHELVGHAATLAHRHFAMLSRAFGVAARRTEDPGMWLALERLYWFTLEFGVALENHEPKAYGAGLLSSYGELGRYPKKAKLVPLDIERVVATPYDPTRYQGTLFVAPSFQAMVTAVLRWLDRKLAVGF